MCDQKFLIRYPSILTLSIGNRLVYVAKGGWNRKVCLLNTIFATSCSFSFPLLLLRATTIATAIFKRAITIWEAIQKRSHEPIYKNYIKNEAKKLRSTTLKVNIVVKHQKKIYFGGTNNIFAACSMYIGQL